MTTECIGGDGLLLESCIDSVTNRVELPIDCEGEAFVNKVIYCV